MSQSDSITHAFDTYTAQQTAHVHAVYSSMMTCQKAHDVYRQPMLLGRGEACLTTAWTVIQ